MSLVLVLVAGLALAWPWIKSHWSTFDPKNLDSRHLAAAALLAAALWSYSRPSPANPEPIPPRITELFLVGKFSGPTAAADAATLAALCRELASELEWDGSQPEPLIKTGVAFDELRRRARVLMCRGESIGDRNPAVREAIGAYLDATAGKTGGALTPESRARWVHAYRQVAEAAEAAR